MPPTPDNPSDTLPDEDWVDAVWLEGYFVLVARAGQVFHSNLHSVQFDQLDFASAETNSDENVGAISFRRRLFIFGSRTVESWANTGGRDFAFSRDNTFVVNIGCPAKHTIHADDLAIYFLGGDGIVYALASSQPVRISHEGVETDIAASDMSAARAYTYTEQGHKFYVLTLSTGKTWAFDATTRWWHERTENRILGVAKFDKSLDNIVARNDSLSLYALGLRPFRAPAALSRIAVSPDLFSRTLRAQVHSLEVQTSLKPGETAPAGATATLEVSHTAGSTWHPAGGQTKALAPTMRFNRLGSDRYGLGFRFRLTIDYTPVAGAAPIKVLGAYGTASAGLS